MIEEKVEKKVSLKLPNKSFVPKNKAQTQELQKEISVSVVEPTPKVIEEPKVEEIFRGKSTFTLKEMVEIRK